MKMYKDLDNQQVGRMLIRNAINMEDSLAELLRIEVKSVKKRLKDDYDYEYLQRTNKLIKYILYSMSMLDERIQVGLELIKKE